MSGYSSVLKGYYVGVPIGSQGLIYGGTHRSSSAIMEVPIGPQGLLYRGTHLSSRASMSGYSSVLKG